MLGLDFGFPGLAAEEILETWSWLQREQKAGSKGQSTRTSIYSYVHVCAHVRTKAFCKEGAGEWNGGYIAC